MPSRLGLQARSKSRPAGRGSGLRDLRATVEIVPSGEGDVPLLERLDGDPAMMEHLGGAESRSSSSSARRAVSPCPERSGC
jgi:hypothetical protein